MKIVSGYLVYKAYITYKSHFSKQGTDISKYDYTLFNMSYSSFLETKGQHFYDKIAKRLQKEKRVISVLISAFMDNPNVWIGDISNEINHYIEMTDIREGRITNMPYLFRNDCLYLLREGMCFDDSMGSFVLSKFMKSKIELESFIILKKMFNYNLDNNMEYTYLYMGKYESYESLLRVDINKYKLILEEAIMIFKG